MFSNSLQQTRTIGVVFRTPKRHEPYVQCYYQENDIVPGSPLLCSRCYNMSRYVFKFYEDKSDYKIQCTRCYNKNPGYLSRISACDKDTYNAYYMSIAME